MTRKPVFPALGAIFAFMSVGLGAFGAHILKAKITPEALAVFEKGVHYQFSHSFALLFLLIFQRRGLSVSLPGWFFTLGIILFSGSLYLLAYKNYSGIEGMRWVGPVTPVGGLCFLSGWVSMFFLILKDYKS